MNERILELLEKAGVRLNCHGQPIPASLASNFDEFVNLIVNECADICYNREYAYGSAYGDSICEHFGVNE